MNLKDKDAKFKVYMHVSPKGKRYIGITTKKPEERWGKDGTGYRGNRHFWNAIQKYGWDNFEHVIVVDGLSIDEACNKEIELITKYNTMDPNYGYNYTSGGNWSKPNAEIREILRRKGQERWKDPKFRNNIVNKLTGHPMSDATRAKISRANKGRKMSEEFCQKQRARKHSPETIAKLKSHPGWQKGLSIDDPRMINVRRAIERRRGIPMPEEQKQHLREKIQERYANGFKLKWITNGKVELYIHDEDPIPEGFWQGRTLAKNIYVYKDDETKKISDKEFENYAKLGWKRGRSAKYNEAVTKGCRKYYWTYQGMRFDNAEQLAQYLRDNGFPKIVSSTITSLYNKGFDKSSKYCMLDGLIKRFDICK